MKRAWWIAAALLVLGGGLLGYFGLRTAPTRGPVLTPEEIQALTSERDRLRDELHTLLADHAGLDVARAQTANVLLGVPTSFARNVVSQLVTGVFSEVRVHLTDIETSAEGSVTVPVAGNVGSYSVFVEVKEVRAVIHPGQPDLQFGADRIGVRLPVTLDEGSGTAAIDVRWQSRGLTAVCGDLNVSTVISTGVRPATHTVAGELQFAVVDETLVATARSDVMTTRIWLQPTEKTWDALEATIEEIRKDLSFLCAAAINRLNTRGLVQGLIDRGFPVNVPSQHVEDIVVPAQVETSVALPDRTVTLEARPMNVRITGDMLWYGVTLGATAAPSATPQR